MLHDWLVWYPKDTACGEAPVRGIESYRGLLESLASAAKRKEALRVQVREHEDKDVERQICNGRNLVSHSEESEK